MHDFTWFGWLSDKINHHNIHIATAAFVGSLIIFAAFLYNKSLKSVAEEVIPDGSFGLKGLFQVAVEWLLDLMESIIGPDAKTYFPLIGALFIYIFINNLFGIVPGFVPATDNINTTLSLGVTVFVYYNFMGIWKNGLVNYLKHFMGPIVWMAPLMLVIELISHLVRPLSLGIRLFGNMTGDHVVLGIFSGAQGSARDARRVAEIDALAKNIESTRDPQTGYYYYPQARFNTDYPVPGLSDPVSSKVYCQIGSTSSSAFSGPTGNPTPWTGPAYPIGGWASITGTTINGVLGAGNDITDSASIRGWKVCATLERSNTVFCKSNLIQ